MSIHYLVYVILWVRNIIVLTMWGHLICYIVLRSLVPYITISWNFVPNLTSNLSPMILKVLFYTITTLSLNGYCQFLSIESNLQCSWRQELSISVNVIFIDWLWTAAFILVWIRKFCCIPFFIVCFSLWMSQGLFIKRKRHPKQGKKDKVDGSQNKLKCECNCCNFVPVFLPDF